MNLPKILIVDDERLFTTALKMYLDQSGEFEVRVENDPLRALAVASEFLPDAVILDVIMPGLDGGEVAAKFAADPILREVPIIMMTALATEVIQNPEDVIQARPVNILPKPVRPDVLMEYLRKAVQVRGAVGT